MISASLTERLRRAGLDPSAVGDPEKTWTQLHDVIGSRATLIDRYDLEMHHRGIDSIDEIPADERRAIALRVMRAHTPGMELVGESGGDPVEVVAYDDGWPDRFQEWKRRLETVLDPTVSIHHVGSTSVPGLASKPVIDVLVVVTDVDDERAYLPGIESIGVPLRSREPDHRYFRPSPGAPRVVQIHVSNREWARDHLLFRDYLRIHSDARDAYAALKRRLAATYRDDRLAYTDGKTEFILDTLERAASWAGNTGRQDD